MLGNMKIGTRLGLGFAIVLGLLAVIATLAITRVGTLNTVIETVVNDRMPKTAVANAWIDEVNVIARTLRNCVISNDAAFIEKEMARIQESRDKLDKDIAYLDSTIKSDAGRAKLSEATAFRKDIRAGQDRILAWAKQNEDAAAAEYLFGDYRELQGKYLKAVNGLIEFQQELATQDGKTAEELAESTLTQLIALVVAAIFIGIAFAWYVTRSITRPLNSVMDVARKVSQGHMDLEISTTAQDETGDLARAMGALVSTIKQMIADMSMYNPLNTKVHLPQ
jgi:methyl-accepting chemotaxis protein